MEEQPIVMPESEMPVAEPVAPVRNRLLLPPWVIALIVVIIGTVGVLIATGLLRRPAPAQEAIVEAQPTATPTPIRAPSALATQSGFLALEQAVASLSANVAAQPAQDPSLAPPTLDLELGFDE